MPNNKFDLAVGRRISIKARECTLVSLNPEEEPHEEANSEPFDRFNSAVETVQCALASVNAHFKRVHAYVALRTKPEYVDLPPSC